MSSLIPEPLPTGGFPSAGMTDAGGQITPAQAGLQALAHAQWLAQNTPSVYRQNPPPGIHWFGPGGSGVAYPQPGLSGIHEQPGTGYPNPFALRPVALPPGGIRRPGLTPADHMHGLVAAHAAKQAAARAALRRPRFF